MPRKSPYLIDLTEVEKKKLEQMAQKYTAPYFSVLRARIVLLAAEGLDNDKIAAKFDIPRRIVSKWRKRFFEERIPGLNDQPRSGRPARFSPQDRSGG
jgi:transposase